MKLAKQHRDRGRQLKKRNTMHRIGRSFQTERLEDKRLLAVDLMFDPGDVHPDAMVVEEPFSFDAFDWNQDNALLLGWENLADGGTAEFLYQAPLTAFFNEVSPSTMTPIMVLE